MSCYILIGMKISISVRRTKQMNLNEGLFCMEENMASKIP